MAREASSPGTRKRASVGRKRREPETPKPAQSALPSHTAAPRYRFVSYPDGSRRPERYASQAEGMKKQAEADFYGSPVPLSTGANVRDASSLLTEVLSRVDLRDADFSPEFLALIWRHAVGDFLASQSSLVSLTNGCATIRSLHPTVSFELRRQRDRLISKLNASFGENCVKTVRILQR